LIKILREGVGVVQDRQVHEIDMAIRREQLETTKIRREAAEIERQNKILENRAKDRQLLATRADIYDVVERNLEPYLEEKRAEETDRIKRDISNDVVRLLNNEQIKIKNLEELDK
jgi:hypothetical protein